MRKPFLQRLWEGAMHIHTLQKMNATQPRQELRRRVHGSFPLVTLSDKVSVFNAY